MNDKNREIISNIFFAKTTALFIPVVRRTASRLALSMHFNESKKGCGCLSVCHHPSGILRSGHSKHVGYWELTQCTHMRDNDW